MFPPNRQTTIPETVTNFFRNVQRNGRFSPIGGNRDLYRRNFPPHCQPFPINFCNVQSNGQFSPIGGNRAILADEIALNCQAISHPRDFLSNIGRFSQIGGNRAIFTDKISPHIAKPFAFPKTATHVFCNVQSNGRFSPIGGKRAFSPMNFPPKVSNNLPSQRPSQISFGS